MNTGQGSLSGQGKVEGAGEVQAGLCRRFVGELTIFVANRFSDCDTGLLVRILKYHNLRKLYAQTTSVMISRDLTKSSIRYTD